jgi:hypothetical protein
MFVGAVHCKAATFTGLLYLLMVWQCGQTPLGEYTSLLLGKTQFFIIGTWGKTVFGWRIHKLIVGEYTFFHYRKSLKELENTQFWWRIHKLSVWEYTIFTIGNPLSLSRIHSFWWRIHKLIVGEYTVSTIGNLFTNLRIHSFWWRIHKLIVGKYTFFNIGNPLW